jgi:Fe-S-cluster containining protein
MSADHPASDGPWYRDGLAFTCTRCGACCTGTPGFVWVDVDEIERLADYRKEDLDTFGKQFLRRVGRRYSLVEKPNGDCVFWESGRGCTVYPARPTQCQTWPFWDENVETPDDWKQTQAHCPGSGKGQLYSVEEIEASLIRSRKRKA